MKADELIKTINASIVKRGLAKRFFAGTLTDDDEQYLDDSVKRLQALRRLVIIKTARAMNDSR